MKQKHFYTHLIDTNILYKALDELNLHKIQRDELLVLVESSIHYIVLDTTLSGLPKEDKKVFLLHIEKQNHSAVWKILKRNIKDVENKIQERVERFLQELNSDVQNTRF